MLKKSCKFALANFRNFKICRFAGEHTNLALFHFIYFFILFFIVSKSKT